MIRLVTATDLTDIIHQTFGGLQEQLRGDNRLIQAVARRQYVLFLGAGIPASMGYPGWDELVEGVRQEVGRSIRLSTIHPLEQAQVVWNHYVNNVFKARPITDATQRTQAELEFNKIVLSTLQRLYKPSRRPDWFDLLQKYLPVNIVTTNWDKTIETELLDGLVNCFCFCAGMPSVNRRLPNLYKIHGDVADPRYLVFTEDQFYRWEQDDTYLVAKLRVLFSENVTLCMGYSFRDPNVQHQHFRAFLRFQGSVEPVYLLIDPTMHRKDEWGLLKERREYYGSRNVTVLFGSIPELLELLEGEVKDYAQSAAYRLESIEPIKNDLLNWRNKLETTDVRQHWLRLPTKASTERLILLTKGLILVGLFPEIREVIGLDIGEGMPHEVGIRLLEDLRYLLVNHNVVKEHLSESDYLDLVALLNRFSTKDGGAWQFGQQRVRFNLVLDLLPFLPVNILDAMAPTLAEHLLFSGPSYGDCWGSWNDIDRRVNEIPMGLVRPVIEELIQAESWSERRVKIQEYLQDDKALTRLGIRLRLLQKHPGWKEVTGV